MATPAQGPSGSGRRTGGADETAETVVLVDEADRAIGIAPKLGVHRTGQLHRAVSVFITDGSGGILLQQRAPGKYHSPGMWSNAACGHPRPGERAMDAAGRRLLEEMGIECALEQAGTFLYCADLGEGLIEHELDHVFVGKWDARPDPDPGEVGGWRWVACDMLLAELASRPAQYTAWLPRALAVAATHPLLGGCAR